MANLDRRLLKVLNNLTRSLSFKCLAFLIFIHKFFISYTILLSMCFYERIINKKTYCKIDVSRRNVWSPFLLMEGRNANFRFFRNAVHWISLGQFSLNSIFRSLRSILLLTFCIVVDCMSTTSVDSSVT